MASAAPHRFAVRFRKELECLSEDTYLQEGLLLLHASFDGFEVTALVCDPSGLAHPVTVRVRWPGMPYGRVHVETLSPIGIDLGACEVSAAWHFASLLLHVQAELTFAPSIEAPGASEEALSCLEVLEQAAERCPSAVLVGALSAALASCRLGPSRELLRGMRGRSERGGIAFDFCRRHSAARLARSLFLRASRGATPGRLPSDLKELVADFAFHADYERPPEPC